MGDTSNFLLGGIRVVEVGTFIAGPAAATVMTDFGAEVTKIEAPGIGDPYRYLHTIKPMPESEQDYCWILDGRNKKSVVVNLKSEAGVHRLVRISPFDAQGRRYTSFAAVEVLTEIDKNIEIEVREDDLRMDVFRASGAGGQHVNKTNSAVRLTHAPTGTVVSCQMERSQHRNREHAMAMLKAKLYDLELQKKNAELEELRDSQQEVAWGSQIRSYVMHPYQMIKDHRTNVEVGNVDKVMDGYLEPFIEGYLKWKLQQRSN